MLWEPALEAASVLVLLEPVLEAQKLESVLLPGRICTQNSGQVPKGPQASILEALLTNFD